MTLYIIRRLLTFIPMLLLISLISFAIIQLPPGSFVETRIMELQQLGGDASSIVEVEQLKARYGLDKPVAVQYLMWIQGIVTRGDFGESFAYNQEVTDIIWSYLGYTLLVAGCSLVLVYMLAIPLGVWAAARKYKTADNVISSLSFIGMSIPEFLLCLVLLSAGLFLFDVTLLGLFSPEYQFQAWSWAKVGNLAWHLILPSVVVAVNGTAGMMRIMRGNMLETLGQQYIRAARARGLSRGRILSRHALRMAINPLVSIIGMSLPGLVSGSTIISIVLMLPTAGLLLFESLKSQDMYLAGTLILMMSFILLVGNLLADIALAWVDPRIRYE